MQYVGEVVSEHSLPEVVQTLAAVHYANLNKMEEMDWLPRANEAFIEHWIVQDCWRACWESLLVGGPFIDGYGQEYGVAKAGGDFSAEFRAYTEPIEAAAEEMRAAMKQLWQAGDSLTIINADFHNSNVVSDGTRPYIIDWGAVHYGPLYLDLPNCFSWEEALLYRDALEALGHHIPQDKFLSNYDAFRPYPGFKYFGIGLYNWCFGDPPHKKEHVHHFINMII